MESVLKVEGFIQNSNFKAGDCFKLIKDQPYGGSKTIYEGTGANDFYVPFPASQTY